MKHGNRPVKPPPLEGVEPSSAGPQPDALPLSYKGGKNELCGDRTRVFAVKGQRPGH